MPRENTDYFLKAKEYSFLLLKYRLRSEHELYQRLKGKKFTDDVIKKVISFLKEKQFIDDNVFTKAWVNSRLKRPLGFRRIREELRLKGIKREVIEAGIEKVKRNYSEEEIVKELAFARLTKLRNIDPVKARNRTFAYLIRRGYSPETVIDILKSICKQIS